MILKGITKYASMMLWITMIATPAHAQSNNLLQNPNADEGTSYWHAYGDATVEQNPDGNWRFVLRNKGYFVQDVTLPDGAVGKYALLIGRASSDRINADGAITGLPCLYGYMMEGKSSTGNRIKAYLQGPQMLCRAKRPNEWVTVWGVFEVPSGTGAISFFLNQAERKDVPQNGSAAWLDELGLYLFSTEEEAKAFVNIYNEQKH